MDKLSDLMGNLHAEPDAVAALKSFVLNQYNAEAAVTVTKQAYILAVKSAGLAGNLQGQIAQIQKTCLLDKPLRIRIGY